MKDVCALCRKELDGYYSVDYNNEQYKVCENCYSKLKNKKNSLNDLLPSADTNIIESIQKEEDRIEKKIIAQKDNPLYDDIHQIASDIRFLKNLVIIGLIISIISSLFSIII